jgi:sugar phosphate isomerase/epimerase
MVFDTYHMGQDPSILPRVAELVPHIALVQLGDARQPPHGEQNRCLLGEGNVPLKELIAALAAGGYDSFYDVELLGEEIESLDYGALLAHAKQTFQELVCTGS